MAPRKICVVTGSRADYGLLYPLLDGLKHGPEFALQIIATGMHLSPEFGLTYRVIEDDGFVIDARVETLLSSDTPVGIAKSLGLGVIGFADSLARLTPDLLVVLGDRFEILAAAQAALVARIPIAHIAGGDLTEGAYDEAMRHSITKMAHLHFVTNAAARLRVRQLGENPRYIFQVGSPGLDYLFSTPRLSREEVQRRLEFKFRPRNLLITYHPETLAPQPAQAQFQAVLAALERLGEDISLIFTKSNADNDSRLLSGLMDAFVREHPQARAYTSLGQELYLSVMAQVDAVIGNSSSGLYEAPSLKKPTVNIGYRQKGRLQAASVLNCPAEPEAIYQTVMQAFSLDCSQVVNPYGDGRAAPRIIETLKTIPDYRTLLMKEFFDIEGTACER